VLSPSVAIPNLSEEAVDSERIVLGNILLNPKLLSDLTITGAHFTKRHRPIVDAMLGLAVNGQDFDTIILSNELRRRGQLEANGALYISSLTEGPRYYTAKLQEHCGRIRSASLRRELARLCDRVLAGCYDLTSDPAIALAQLRDQAAEIDSPASRGSDLGLISGDEVKPETAELLIDPYVPKGCLSLLVGDPGDGKTWVGLSLAAGLTRGTVPFAGGSSRPQSVLYLSNEDGPGELRARFDKLGGDPSQIWFESADHTINLVQAGAIEAAVEKHGAVLVVIDTITSHFGAKADFHKASEVAAVLGPLAAMGQRTGAAILGLMHLSKSMQGKSLYRVQGSTAFAGAARSVLGVGHDPSDPTKRILVHMKSNGGAQGSSREFVIDSSGVTWGDVSGLGAADVLGPETQAEERGALSAAKDFLREALSHGSRDMQEVQSEAKSQDIKEITLRRAKTALGVKSRKKSVREGWIWWLPEDDHEGDHEGDQQAPTVQTMITLGNDDHLGKNKGLIEDILPVKHEGDHTCTHYARETEDQ
jgi:hypothetical protein